MLVSMLLAQLAHASQCQRGESMRELFYYVLFLCGLQPCGSRLWKA